MNHQEIFKRPVWQALLGLGIPSLISVLVTILYNLADMYFIGFLHDYTQTASVSLVMPVFSLLTAISMLLGSGGCTLIAQSLGAGDTESVRGYSSLCVWASVVLGLVVTTLCFGFCTPILRFLGANEEMWPYAQKYLLVLAAGAPAILLQSGLGSLVRGEGAIKPGLVSNFLSTLLNILLDPLFILAFDMGVVGAAVATVLANIAGVAFLAWYKRRSSLLLTFDPRAAAGYIRRLGKVAVLGMPNAVSNTLNGLASTFSNQLLVAYGTGAVAAMAAAGKSTMVVGIMQMGICMGVQPLIAYCYGGKDLPRLKEVMTKLLILTVGLGLALGGLGMLGSRILVGLFIQDAGVLALGQRMVLIQLISAPVVGLYYISNNFLQAAGRAVMATVASVLRQGVLLIPLLFLCDTLFGLMGIPAAHVISDLSSILIAGMLAVYTYRQVCKSLANVPETKHETFLF